MIPPIAIRLTLASALALLSGWLIIRNKESRKEVSNVLLNAVWFFLLGVKSSLLLTHLSTIKSEPLFILYGWGNNLNILIGFLIILVYFTWFLLKKSTSKRKHGTYLLISTAVFGIAFFSSTYLIKLPNTESNNPLSIELRERNDAFGQPLVFKEGEITILNFWATWCPPCRAEMPELEAFATKHPEVNFILVNNIESEKEGIDGVTNFLKAKGYSFDVLPDFNSHFTSAYGISSFPTTMVFDEQGNFVDKRVGVVSVSYPESFLEH